MGTAESILYDTTPPTPPTDHQGARTASPDDGVQPPPSSNRQHLGAGRRRSGGGSVRGSSSGRPRRPHPQRRANSSGNLLTLKGVLLGLPSSGKRTLLERLEGRDPFSQTITSAPTEPRSTTTTVPYQQPPSVTVWDRIQLQVEISHSVDDNKVDFAVVLVNPRHKNIRHYIEKIVTSLLQQAGYTEHHSKSDEEEDSDENDEGEERQKPTKISLSPTEPLNPVCLCLLLNFRDLLGDDSDNNTDEPDDERLKDEADLKNMVEQVLTQLHPTFAKEKRIVIQYGTTSLLNCYGLSTLHHFIYQSYLQRKQADCERHLRNIRREIDLSNQALPRVCYEDHLKLIQSPSKQQREARTSKQEDAITNRKQKKGTRPRIKEEKQKHHKGARVHTNGGQEVRRPVDEHEPRELSDDEDSQKEQVMQSHLKGQRRRMVMQQEPHPPRRTVLPSSYHEDSKTALDAFFADDDDEYVVPAAQQKKKTRNDSSSSGEDDDDFYYDEGGQRRGHNHPVFSYDDSSSSSEEEEMPPQPRPTTQASQPARKRPCMPSISESSSHEEEPHPENVDKSNMPNKSMKHGKNGSKGGKPISEAASSNAPEVGASPPEKASPQTPVAEPAPEQNHSDEKRPAYTDGQDEKPDKETPGRNKDETTESEEPVTSVDESNTELEDKPPNEPEKRKKESKAVQEDKESRMRKGANGSDSKQAAEPVTNNRNGTLYASARANDDSSNDDDEFVVGEVVVKSDNSIGPNTAPKSQKPVSSRASEDTPKKESSSGEKVVISSVALAAIAAAQREAEQMLQQNVEEQPLEQEAPPRSRTKKSKKKKQKDPQKAEKREKKKKKKRDKERRAKELSQGGE